VRSALWTIRSPFFASPEFCANSLSRTRSAGSASLRTSELEDLMGAIVFLASDAPALMTAAPSPSTGAGPRSKQSRWTDKQRERAYRAVRMAGRPRVDNRHALQLWAILPQLLVIVPAPGKWSVYRPV
jgi:hypothetical protein